MKNRFSRFLYLLMVTGGIALNWHLAYAEDISVAPSESDVTISNNVGKSDIIDITGLTDGDIVKVYNAATAGRLLGSGSMQFYKDYVSIRVPQLGTKAGSVYILVKSEELDESERVKFDYLAEAISEPISPDNVIITNNAGKSDTIDVSAAVDGDIIKVYSAITGGRLLGSAQMQAYKDTVTVRVTQLGAKAGSVYISVKSDNAIESQRVKADFEAEPISDPINTEDVTISNNAGKPDIIEIGGLSYGDIVKIYNAATAGKLLASATMTATEGSIKIGMKQLSIGAGNLYISLKMNGYLESQRIPISYSAEYITDDLENNNITVTNNSGTADTVDVSGAPIGDVIKVYDSSTGGTLLGSGVVAAPKGEVTISISQLGTGVGSVYVSDSSPNKKESARIKVDYLAESKTTTPTAANITVINNARAADAVRVIGLATGDIVKVYDSAVGGTLLGTAAAIGYSSEATVTIPQLGVDTGSVYVCVIGTNKQTSARIRATYQAEIKSSIPVLDKVVITNNVGKTDTIKITELLSGDVVKIYDAEFNGNQLATSTVAASSTETTLSVTQLGVDAGSVYMTITSTNRQESGRIKVDYKAEPESVVSNASNIAVTNNVGKADTVKVPQLTPGDIVKVYDEISGGNLLGQTTVTSAGQEATITIPQLGEEVGSVYISIISINKQESDRIKIDYLAEAISISPNINNITVTNNAVVSDSVKVVRLTTGDIVKVYDLTSGGNLLGYATVPNANTEVTIPITQLGTSFGSIYVTVTNINKQESSKTKVDYSAEGTSEVVSINNVSVTNNARAVDTVFITSLQEGDIVKIYDVENAGNLIGQTTVANNSTDATITIKQLGTDAGSVYISVTSINEQESSRVKADYKAETISNSIILKNITVTNNAVIADTIYVTRLTPGDMIKVYDAEASGNLIGQATVANNSNEAIISITQLGMNANSIYISLTSINKQESIRTKVDYTTEATSVAPLATNITVANNVRASDTVYVARLTSGDILKVYEAETSGNLIGQATVASNSTEATVTISQLGVDSGSVYVSITSKNKQESDRVKTDYKAEAISTSVYADNITIANNAVTADTVYITRLSGGDIVKVYDAETSGTLLGSATVGNSSTEATVTISQLRTSAGSVYVSVTSINKQESVRTKVDYLAETVSSAPSETDVMVANNAKAADTVYVIRLTESDLVKVYDAQVAGNLLGQALVGYSSTEVMVTIRQLGTSAGSIYISVTSLNKQESTRTKVAYANESISTAPLVTDITVTNNANTADIINITGLMGADTVKIYDTAIAGNILGTATVSNYSTETVVTIPQIGTIVGDLYVSATSTNKQESPRTKVSYIAEIKTNILDISNVVVTNNARTADTIYIRGISAGDTVKVYDAAVGGNTLGAGTVADNDTEVTISIKQLGTAAGSIYISNTSTNKQESARIKDDYTDELTSNAPIADDVTIKNKSGIASIVTVTGLIAADSVKVYDAPVGGTLLGSGTVVAYDTQVSVSVSQLAAEAGSVYISVTSKNKLESKRTKVDYTAKEISSAPSIENISIDNNAGISDTVTVDGLDTSDIIKVYNAATAGTMLGSATVTSSDTKATVRITQLGAKGGIVYVSLVSVGKIESATRTETHFAAEGQSDAPLAGNIVIYNNVGISDSIQVSGLLSNDIVKVYRTLISTTPLGIATVESDDSEAVVYIKQLGSAAGSLYISVTSKGMTQSDRTMISYVAESFAPDVSNIIITNNSIIADTITVKGLTSNDIIKVYDAQVGGNLLGSATAQSGDNEAKITIPQLTSTAGAVYISVTSYGRSESGRTKADYVSEQTSNALYIGNINIVNNTTGTIDVITVVELKTNDVIKVYSAEQGGTLLGTANVLGGSTQATVKITQLGTNAGTVYISVTSIGKMESPRRAVSFIAED